MINNDFWNALREIYGDDDSWQKEEPMLRQIIPMVEKDIATRYEFQLPFALGGTAVILKVLDTNLNSIQVLKLARPIQGRHAEMAGIFLDEIALLQENIHQNIVRLFFRGEVTADNKKWPYYIMEYVKDAIDGFKYFSTRRTYEDVIKILRQWVEAIAFLHKHEIIHCDLKLENVLITPEGRAVLSDLGSVYVVKQMRQF